MSTRFIIYLALIFLTTACGRPDFGEKASEGAVLGGDINREEVNSGDGVTAGNNAAPDEPDGGAVLEPSGQGAAMADFDFTAYHTLARAGRNAVLAPHGLARSLAIAYAAAGPDEAAAVATILEPYLGGELYGRFNTADQGLEARASNESFDMLGGVWIQEGAVVEQGFVENLARYLGLQARLIDFSTPEDARNTINDWYSTSTDGRIGEVLGARTLDQDTRFVVTDSTWFSASWGFAGFDPNRTTYATFAGTESNVELPMMATDDVLLHTAATDFDAVVLPFDNGFSLIAVLPDDLTAFETSLSSDFLQRLLDEATPTPVSLRFPCVEISDRVALSTLALDLGIESLFGADAQYAGFGDATQLQDAYQRTRLVFSEAGVTVSTGTNNDMNGGPEPASPAVSITFDRPFFFAIRDSASGQFVFLGRFAQP